MVSVIDLFYLLYYFAFASLLIIVFVYDLKRKIIPDFASAGILILAFIRFIVQGYGFGFGILFWKTVVLRDFMLAAGVLVIFGSIWFFSKGMAMGFGDVKLAPAAALFLGFPNGVIAALLSFWVGSLVGLFLILTPAWFMNSVRSVASVVLVFAGMPPLNITPAGDSAKITLKSEIPFGPFIALGAFIALLWGNDIINAYFSFLLQI